MTESAQKNEVAVSENHAIAPVLPRYNPRFSEEQIAESNLSNASQLQDLSNAAEHFMPLGIDYWSPEKHGESRAAFITGVDIEIVPDFNTKQPIELECASMAERQGDKLIRLRSGSKILVGIIKSAIERGEIIPMTQLTPVRITYLGKKKSKSGNQCDNWQVTPLVVANN